MVLGPGRLLEDLHGTVTFLRGTTRVAFRPSATLASEELQKSHVLLDSIPACPAGAASCSLRVVALLRTRCFGERQTAMECEDAFRFSAGQTKQAGRSLGARPTTHDGPGSNPQSSS